MDSNRGSTASRSEQATRGGDDDDDDDKANNNNNNNNNNKKTENILCLLRDESAVPVGVMTRQQIIEAEDALEYWVHTAASLPRPRRQRNQKRRPNTNTNTNDQQLGEKYKWCFGNAQFLLTRLAREQRFLEEQEQHCYDRDARHTNTSEGGARTESMDKDSSGEMAQKEQQNGGNQSIRDGGGNGDGDSDSDDCYTYFVRPFLLNRVVDCWRIGWRDRRLDFTPNEMMGWVEELDADNRTLTMIVDGICLRGDPYEAPLLAQWLLDRRLGQAYAYDDEEEEDYSLRPDTVFFTNVIRAWAKSGRIEAPEMAEGLLKMMHELYSKSGWIESAPNAFSYAATMEAWSKSQRHPESTKRIEELLEEMKNSSLLQVAPDRVCYQYLLNAWANSKSPIGAEKAYHVLQEMIALYEAGNFLVAPNASNFSRVILALAQNGNDERVESLLEQLQDLYTKTGDPNFRPTDECWKACIIAKTKTGGVAEAQGMLDELVERALSSNNHKLMPLRSYFVDTLVAWTKTNDRVLAAKMAQNTLERMMELARHDESYRNLQPDARSFEKVILAWSRSRHHFAPERIEQLILEMERQARLGNNDKMQSSLAGYTNLMLAWQRSGRKESMDSIQTIFENLQNRSATRSECHLRPDRYVFGIVIDSWARRNNLKKIEVVFGEMMAEWKNGNKLASPDIHIFHKILKVYSEGNRHQAFAVPQCEHYISLMKEVGLPMTIQAYSYLIHAITANTSSESNQNLSRANMVLEEALESVRNGTTHIPSDYKNKEYRYFLQTIANSSIPRRNEQAKKILATLSRGSDRIPKELLPPL
eukprot:jgi/Psemu1/180290/e_gw1.14.31.1